MNDFYNKAVEILERHSLSNGHPYWYSYYSQDKRIHHNVDHILSFNFENCPSLEAAIAAILHDADYSFNSSNNIATAPRSINSHQARSSGLWYHATSLENWRKIQAEGVLWGIRNAPSRCTYLAAEMQDAVDGEYGEVLLAVDFQPETDVPNNYVPGEWQCRVYSPIPLSRVRMIHYPNVDSLKEDSVDVEYIKKLIMTTSDHVSSFAEIADNADYKLYNDVFWLHKNDLAYLREKDPLKIIETEHKMFFEYQHVSFKIYREKRIEILSRYAHHPMTSENTIEDIISFLRSWKPRIGLYPGSFNPFHKGHEFILHEAERLFDKVVVAQGQNLNKPPVEHSIVDSHLYGKYECTTFTNIFDLIKSYSEDHDVTVVRGIRNGGDLSDELVLQSFIREQTNVPCINIFTANEYAHISSGAIRQLDHLGVTHDLIPK